MFTIGAGVTLSGYTNLSNYYSGGLVNSGTILANTTNTPTINTTNFTNGGVINAVRRGR